jgi:hypothetical protein
VTTERSDDDLTPIVSVPVFALAPAERSRIFGSFTWAAAPTPDNKEAITIAGDWVARNILTIATPQLAPLGIQHVRFHRLGTKQLTGLLDAWSNAGLLTQILAWDGAFVSRLKRGKAGSSNTADLSNHSWGTAFDINAKWNALGAVPAFRGQPGCVRDLVPIARHFGFFWGGDFRGRIDGMHFELCRLIP